MISVITAAYNCETYIAQAIASVQAQTYQDWEMIVVDDRSSDNTANIVTQFSATDSRIRLIKAEYKLLASGARNLAIQNAKGQYIAMLDSDDLWANDKLEQQLDFMQKNGFPISATAYQKMDAEGKVSKRVIEAEAAIGYQDMLYLNRIGCLTVMYDAQKLGKLYFDASYHYQEDYLLWLEVLKNKTPTIFGLNKPLAFYRVHSQAKSANKWRVALYRLDIYERFFKYSFTKRWYYFGLYVFYGLLKYLK